jgi:hypothetical protein
LLALSGAMDPLSRLWFSIARGTATSAIYALPMLTDHKQWPGRPSAQLSKSAGGENGIPEGPVFRCTRRAVGARSLRRPPRPSRPARGLPTLQCCKRPTARKEAGIHQGGPRKVHQQDDVLTKHGGDAIGGEPELRDDAIAARARRCTSSALPISSIAAGRRCLTARPGRCRG